MLEILTLVIGNGSTWGPLTYEPWIPFYQFIPSMLTASIGLPLILKIIFDASMTRAVLWGAVCLTSGFAAVPVVFLYWLKLDFSPLEVFGWWLIHFMAIMIGQIYFITKSDRVKERIKRIEERENAD